MLHVGRPVPQLQYQTQPREVDVVPPIGMLPQAVGLLLQPGACFGSRRSVGGMSSCNSDEPR